MLQVLWVEQVLRRALAVAGGTALLLAGLAPAQAARAPDERAAVFKAAGFKPGRDGQYVRCVEDVRTLSYTPGQIELVDLNGDGRPEAWVTETSSFCYGAPHTYFVLVRKEAGGWRKLLEDVGIPVVLKTRRHGWPDIEVGGPGFGAFPVYRYNGRAYVRAAPTQR